VLWGPSSGLKARVAILYVPDDPNNARLASFTARFSMTLTEPVRIGWVSFWSFVIA
jgi:hypothetical protein